MTSKCKDAKNKIKVRSAPIAEWPEADRDAWQQSCQPGTRLRRGGAAGHLKPVTRDDIERRYGYFVDFLVRTSRHQPFLPAAENVTRENVDAYIAELSARVSSVTVHGSIYKLRRAAEWMSPDTDFQWLREIENDLAFVMQPRPKHHRLVLADRIVAAALSEMTEADAVNGWTSLRKARRYRNALMLAVLAYCPIRLKNFAALELGRSFISISGRWWIILGATETKEERRDERALPIELTPAIDRYVNYYRANLSMNGQSAALWLSENHGRGLSYNGIARIVSATTRTLLGVDVSPHLFRMAAASTAAIYDGANPNLGPAILHHRDKRTTDEHYQRHSSLNAVQEYSSILNKLSKR
jgi:integrase